MNSTKIEWCDRTLNAVVGCTYGCPFCYARRMNKRFGWVEDFSKPQFSPDRLKQLYSKKPQIIFMDSMSDIADWQDEWIIEVYKAMRDNPQHRYLFLTKRMSKFCVMDYRLWNSRKIAGEEVDNALFGISVIRQADVPNSMDNCGDFWSIEPILEPIICNFQTAKILDMFVPHWVIIGAETGNRKEKVVPKKEWIDSIVSECDAAHIPVFMKNSLLPIMGEENMRREFPKELKIHE